MTSNHHLRKYLMWKTEIFFCLCVCVYHWDEESLSSQVFKLIILNTIIYKSQCIKCLTGEITLVFNLEHTQITHQSIHVALGTHSTHPTNLKTTPIICLENLSTRLLSETNMEVSHPGHHYESLPSIWKLWQRVIRMSWGILNPSMMIDAL